VVGRRGIATKSLGGIWTTFSTCCNHTSRHCSIHSVLSSSAGTVESLGRSQSTVSYVLGVSVASASLTQLTPNFKGGDPYFEIGWSGNAWVRVCVWGGGRWVGGCMCVCRLLCMCLQNTRPSLIIFQTFAGA
jgi:hypothetical protein